MQPPYRLRPLGTSTNSSSPKTRPDFKPIQSCNNILRFGGAKCISSAPILSFRQLRKPTFYWGPHSAAQLRPNILNQTVYRLDKYQFRFSLSGDRTISLIISMTNLKIESEMNNFDGHHPS